MTPKISLKKKSRAAATQRLRALSTPHKLHSEIKIGKHKAEASPEEASKPPKNGKRTVR